MDTLVPKFTSSGKVPKQNNGRINDEIPLIKQPHGGALKARGTPGNTGGGRPKDRIKAALTADLEEGLKQLGEALRDNKLTVTEKQRHIEMSLRYTLPVPKAGYDNTHQVRCVSIDAELVKPALQIRRSMQTDRTRASLRHACRSSLT